MEIDTSFTAWGNYVEKGVLRPVNTAFELFLFFSGRLGRLSLFTTRV
jgi:hypothetical protein